jgi:hypothetical protein
MAARKENKTADGFIKLDRGLLNWEYWEDDAMVKTWVALLILANHEDRVWNGITIRRGQLVTSLGKLEKLLAHKKGTIRSTIARMKRAQQITQESTQRYTIITVCNYERYQGVNSYTAHNTAHNDAHKNRTKSGTKTAQKRALNKNISGSILYSSPNGSEYNTLPQGVSGDFLKFQEWIETHAAEVAKMQQPFTEAQYQDIQQNFDPREVADVLEDMSNTANLLKKYKSAYKTCKSWLKVRRERRGGKQTTDVSKKPSKVEQTLQSLKDSGVDITKAPTLL